MRRPSGGCYAVEVEPYPPWRVLLKRKRPRARESRPRPPVLWSAAATDGTSADELGQCRRGRAYPIRDRGCRSHRRIHRWPDGHGRRCPDYADPADLLRDQPHCCRFVGPRGGDGDEARRRRDRKSTRLNSRHMSISYAGFCLKKKKEIPARIAIELNSQQSADTIRTR